MLIGGVSDAILGFVDRSMLPAQTSFHFADYSNELTIIVESLVLMHLIRIFIHKSFPRMRPTMTVILGAFHIFALVGIWKIFTLSPTAPTTRGQMLRDVFILYLMGGLGVTAGAHRLWAHRAYKANFPYRFVVMVFNSIANQGSIYHWSRDHRLHHRYSEKPPDPHNAMKGFFYAHMGWLLMKKPEVVVAAGKHIDVSDLKEDYAVMLQEVLDPYWNVTISWILPSVYGYWAYGSFWTGFFTLAALRWIITLHCTWTVNSVAHLWGPRPYNANIGPVESFVTALVACGEGWHNWHHQYAFDYATSEHGALRQYNPTKAFIDFFAAIGWVWDRKRATRLWELTKRKRVERQRAAMEALGEAKKLSIETSESGTAVSSISSQSSSLDASNVPMSSLHPIFANLPNVGIPSFESLNSLLTSANENVALPSFISAEKLSKLIPSGCYKISVVRSTLYLLRDLIAVALISSTVAILWVWVSRTKLAASSVMSSSLSSSGSFLFFLGSVELALFAVYSLAQGTVMMAIWVAAYESAGGRFSRWKGLNGVVGVVLSIILLIPYQSRRHVDTTSKKANSKSVPSAAAHLCRALYEDVFSIFNMSRLTCISPSAYLPLGGISASVSISLLTFLLRTFGWRSIACWYMGSWFVMNMWLLLYHHLLLVKVHRAFNLKHDMSGFGIAQAEKNDGHDAKNDEQDGKKDEQTTEQMLNDVVDGNDVVGGGEEEVDQDVLEGVNIDPHSIAEIQRNTSEPLTRSTVDFFTEEWLTSAIMVFERTVLLKNSDPKDLLPAADSAPRGIYVRFFVKLLLFLFGSLHHHLAQVNILQSIDLSIPHYHTKEAVRALRAYTRAHQLLSSYARGQSTKVADKAFVDKEIIPSY